MDDDRMKLRAFAVIDTNVVVSAMLTKTGMPAKVLSYVDQGNIIPLYDHRTIAEYKRVLNYEKLHFRAAAKEQALAVIVDNGILVTDVRETEREIIDKEDVPFFEVKASTENDLDSYLVTGNKRHFPVDDSHIVTPSEMVRLMRQLNSFVEKDWYYPKDLAAAVKAILGNNPKYVPGKKCAESFGVAAGRAIDAPTQNGQAPETGKDETQGQGWSR